VRKRYPQPQQFCSRKCMGRAMKKEFCVNGHPLVGANVGPRGQCKACNTIYCRQWRDAKKVK
jgi:hypothetical protein